jgi:hypothetical protein
MDDNDKARHLEERAARSRDLRKLSSGRGHRREDWLDPLSEPDDPPDELGLLDSQMSGHRWNGWSRLTCDEDYYAVCSCGWCSTDTGEVRAMLRQVKGHLDAVRAVRGWGPAARIAQASARAAQERDASRRKAGQERVRELYAAVKSQQGRLSQALGQSTDLLSASEEQADRLAVALEHAAAALAVMTEEIAGIHLGLEVGHKKAIDWIYGERLMKPT